MDATDRWKKFAKDQGGILVVGHGTRKADGVQQLLNLTLRIQELIPQVPVQASFLELAAPTIEEGLQSLLSQGVHQFLSLPILLFEAGHAKQDIPDAIDEALGKYRDLEFLGSTPPLSCHPEVLALSSIRFREALYKENLSETEHASGLSPSIRTPDLQSIAWGIVGRGGSDSVAIEAMLRFARLRLQETPVGWTMTGFMAVARPSLDELLQAAMETDLPSVVIQPHLLFEGLLMDQIREKVEEFRGIDAKKRWLVTEPLGSTKELASIFVRFAESLLASRSVE